MADGQVRGGEHIAFEHMLVHNLKAPLTGMMASLEMLQDGDFGALNEQQRAALGSMQVQGADLVRMIDELLDMARAEAASFTVHSVPLDPAEFLRGLRTEWATRLAHLTSSVSPDVPDALADANVLRRVFENLLLNALQHAGPNASVILQADRSGDAVRFTVADDGPGIPEAEGERIFAPFVTLDATSSRRTHGLGLAYCRAALAAMGGTIALAPSKHGAMFVVQLPAATILTRQAVEQEQ
jgi:signal transduction histidine kinase